MAFSSSSWQPGVRHLVARNRQHAYNTADALATVVGSGYFNSVTKDLLNGDIILVSAGIGGTQATAQIAVTSASGAATVTTVQAP